MERMKVEDMVKALKCVASQDREGDCYADQENFKHMENDKYKRIVCGTGENLKDWISGRDAVGCPYRQKMYGTCCEDGELYWLKDVAELLEELKSYKDLEEQGLLVKLPCKVGDDVHIIPSPSVYGLNIINGYEKHNKIYHQHVGTIIIADGHWYATSREEYGVYNEKVLNDIDFGTTWFLTHEEAEKKLKDMKKMAEMENENQGIARQTAEALKKQIPKEPKYKKQLRDFFGTTFVTKGDCPCCGKAEIYSNANYCPDCGQKLNWGKEEDNGR